MAHGIITLLESDHFIGARIASFNIVNSLYIGQGYVPTVPWSCINSNPMLEYPARPSNGVIEIVRRWSKCPLAGGVENAKLTATGTGVVIYRGG